MKKWFTTCVLISVAVWQITAQCDAYRNDSLSQKTANYIIDVTLDHNTHTAKCRQQLTWNNPSPQEVDELRFYMYMNAFKNTESTYLKGGKFEFFGESLWDRGPETWGRIDIESIKQKDGTELVQNVRYIQPNDGNSNDQSLLSVPLPEAVGANQHIVLDLEFTVKLPEIMVRPGYSKDDYHLFVHWFPQVCVYEQKEDEKWGWNSHQFFRTTEFFADFGDYQVTVDASDHLVIDGTGCKKILSADSGRQRLQFTAYDVIDFGFVAYPLFEVYKEKYKDVDITLLIPPEHCAFAPRYLEALRFAFEYLEKNIGPYPYPRITVVDPPIHALRSGFMEYPMMITCASFYGLPKGVRTMESLVIHEFTHMYFMAILASNEKEEAWLDEGFVTYFEDRIIDEYYGEKGLINLFGMGSGNAENSRLEYTKLRNPYGSPIATPGYEFKGDYKGIFYAKTATMLRTLERLVGEQTMDRVIQRYFQKHAFTHPTESDFRAVVDEVLTEQNGKLTDYSWFFDQMLHSQGVCDYEAVFLASGYDPLPIGDLDGVMVDSSKFKQRYTLARAQRNGTLIFPQEVVITFADGSSEKLNWDGTDRVKDFKIFHESWPTKFEIDSQKKVYLDRDFNNNGIILEPNRKPLVNYSAKAANWVQSVLQWSSFLF